MLVLALAPTFVFALALLVALLKGRYALAGVAIFAWAILALIADAAIGTVIAADAPFGDAWIVVIVQLAGWVPALAAATGAATEGSWWAKSGRPPGPTPLVDTVTNFIWVFAITLLGVLFEGVEILGGAIFCALFAGMLAAVLLFGLGAARSQPA